MDEQSYMGNCQPNPTARMSKEEPAFPHNHTKVEIHKAAAKYIQSLETRVAALSEALKEAIRFIECDCEPPARHKSIYKSDECEFRERVAALLESPEGKRERK